MGLVEYGLIAALVTVAAVGGLVAIGGDEDAGTGIIGTLAGDVEDLSPITQNDDASVSPFTLISLTGVTPGQLIASNIITLQGPSGSVSASADAGEININATGFVAGPASISAGDTLQVRQTAPSGFGQTTALTVTVGSFSTVWSVSTALQDTKPNAFSIPDATGANPSTLVSSSAVAITGFTGSLPVSVEGGNAPEIRINGGAWSSSGSIAPGDTLAVRSLSDAAWEGSTSVTLKLGSSTTYAWSIFNKVQDTTPNAFNFSALTGAAVNTQYDSSAVTVSGFDGPLQIAVSGSNDPQLRINGGSWSSQAFVLPGQSVQLRAISSAQPQTESLISVTLGTVTSAWSITTGQDIEYRWVDLGPRFLSGHTWGGPYYCTAGSVGSTGGENGDYSPTGTRLSTISGSGPSWSGRLYECRAFACSYSWTYTHAINACSDSGCFRNLCQDSAVIACDASTVGWQYSVCGAGGCLSAGANSIWSPQYSSGNSCSGPSSSGTPSASWGWSYECRRSC